MRVFRNVNIQVGLVIFIFFISCASSDELKKNIVGKYASEGENEYDNFRDTLEIRLLDNGNFDVQTIANWSAAKKDDPMRPNQNKKAGEWHSYGPDRTEVASLQVSDTTLRITDPLTGQVKRILVRSQGKILERTSRGGAKKVYHKVM